MALIKCKACKSKVSENAESCPKCGEPVEKKIPDLIECKHCHSRIPNKTKFCPNCHKKNPKKKSLFVKTIQWSCLLVVGFFIVAIINAPESTPEQKAYQAEQWAEKKALRKAEAEEMSVENIKNREFLWMEKGKDVVRGKLKDAASAKFKDVYFFRSEGNPPMTCGQVNSKNSFGGYSGFQRFLSAGESKLTYIEDETPAFPRLWNELCKK